jgi:ankyrin repeat protein
MLDRFDTLHGLYNKKSLATALRATAKKAAAPYTERQRREAIKMGQTIINAAKKGDFEAVKTSIENGENIEARNDVGDTPLSMAASYGHLEIAKILIEKGANVDVRNNGRWTPLIIAAQEGHLEIVKLLIEKGADINAENAYTETPLCLAEDQNIVGILKRLGAKP